MQRRRGENKLGKCKEQQEDHKPGVEPATGRVAGDDARKVASIQIMESLAGHLGLWILSPVRREQGWVILASGWNT